MFGARSRISAPGTRVLARFDDGTPAMVERDVGLGHVIDFSWFPGLSYVHSRDIFPGGFPEEIRRLIIYPTVVGGVRPPVRVSAPMVETPVLLSPAGAAVVLLNWRDKPVQRLALTVQLPFAVSKVRSVMHGAIPFQRQGNSVICVLPVDTADVLSLRP